MRKKLFYIITIFVLLITGCGTVPHLPDPVCDYGLIVCDYTNFICEVYGNNLPDEFCFYTNIACANLTLLCDSTLTSEQKAVLKQTQYNINKRFKESIERAKQ